MILTYLYTSQSTLLFLGLIDCVNIGISLHYSEKEREKIVLRERSQKIKGKGSLALTQPITLDRQT